jgi:hypothetical protein
MDGESSQLGGQIELPYLQFIWIVFVNLKSKIIFNTNIVNF